MNQPSKNPGVAGAPFILPARIRTKSSRTSHLLSGWSLAILALGGCWLSFFNTLRGEWQVNAQYNYGYVVPLLGLALFWRRWPERPSCARGNPSLAAFLTAASLVPLLPLRVILQANPEWRLVFWLHGVLVLALTCCLLYAAGGSTWVRYFAPPLLFMLIAVPWPMSLETALIQNLMRLVAGLTVEVLGWLGIPALQQGNLIQIGAGTVGIDEACSGVRSLQSGLMLSFFLGEMHRFTAWRRIGLVAVSVLVVLIANLARTTFLTWVAATHGLHRMEAWHDTAGILVMCILLPGLVALAHVMKRNLPASRGAQSAARLTQWAMPRWVGIATLAWLAGAEVTTELWYRTREHDLVRNPGWAVAWPVQSPHFRKTSVPQTSLAILRCSESESASWEDEDSDEWSGFLLRWRPGRNSAQLAKGHRPDICFPAAGARLVEDRGQVTVEVHGMALRFRHQIFESGPRLMHVFYCLWPDRVSRHETALLEDGSQLSRLLAVMAGKRNLGQQVLELVVLGPDTNEAALALFRRQLPALIQVDPRNARVSQKKTESTVTIASTEPFLGLQATRK
ncbi:MAG TPA: exosortase/archaeosortase family protein [Candidatus Acidoferrum sp.]|jgi:exosortase|nr:exosortase/archaeosortase family protein [Candidatus Acidoferrum sp.]